MKKIRYIYIYIFCNFPTAGNKRKKKKNQCRTVFGLLPNCIVNLYCKPCNCIARKRVGKIVEKKKLYCNTIFVLQRGRLEGWKVYCNTLYCIAEKEWAAGKLYCNMSSCITRGWLGQEIVLQE